MRVYLKFGVGIWQTCSIGCTLCHNSEIRCAVNDIKKYAWVTMNSDFGSRVRQFPNNCHKWLSHEWHLLANNITADQTPLFTVDNVSFYFLDVILDHRTQNSSKNNYRSPILPLLLGTVFSCITIVTSPQLISYVTQALGTGIVTSYSSIVLACANGAKAIFTGE